MSRLRRRSTAVRYRIPIKLYAFMAILFGIMIVVYAINAKLVLPASYYLDEAVLGSYEHLKMPCDPLNRIRDSFICTSKVYQFIGVNQTSAPWLAGLFIAVLFFYVPTFGGRSYANRAGVYPSFIILTVIWSLVAASFNSGLSKELLALFCLLLSAAFAARGRYLPTLVIFLIYAFFIRAYWVVLVPGSCFVCFVFSKLSFNKAIIASVFMAVALSAAYYLVSGVSMESVRQGINDGRAMESTTEISAMIPDTNFILGAVNTFLIWFSLIFPFRLLMLGAPQHVIVAILMTITVFFLYKAGKRLEALQDRIGQFCLSVLIAFLAVQSLFEPDYGSFVRHISDFMPFGLIAIYRSSAHVNNGARK